VAEVDSFLRAYLRYRDPALTGTEQDRYLAETAIVAERLGARDVPTSRRAVESYYRRLRPALRCDARSREVADALLASGPDALTTSALAIVAPAAIELLPPWAAAMHGRAPSAIGRPVPQPISTTLMPGRNMLRKHSSTHGSQRPCRKMWGFSAHRTC
jgi:uncharacterized protein (DUF2236 family)